jgi:glycerol-3-phosphate acyltransferase PlsY
MVIIALAAYLIGALMLCDWLHERKTSTRKRRS